MARVTLDRVRKIYPNGFEAVKPCSFTIPDGEFLVEGGLVAFCYREGGRTYRTRPDRLGREDGAPIIEASEGERAPEAPTSPRSGSSR